MTATTRSSKVARLTRGLAALITVVISLTLATAGASAHGPDPALGGVFGQNQDLRFRWRAGSEPTAAIKTAVRAAADDANASRGSRAATFSYDGAGANPIGYGIGATCGVNGLACFTREAPNGFTMWLREQGHVYDWGTLRWCQSYSAPPAGCYDAETIALDEFGHVEGLGHHGNWADDSDYGDAAVQTFSRTKPAAGWNVHALGRCDVASLQLQYDVTSWTTKYSTCLDLATVLTMTAAPTGLMVGDATTLTATLKVATSASYGRLGGNPVSGRIVSLQRRAPGTTAWIAAGTMTAGAAAGTYLLAQRPGVDTEYRAIFATPAGEGINGSASATVRVYVSTCIAGAGSAAGPQVACL